MRELLTTCIEKVCRKYPCPPHTTESAAYTKLGVYSECETVSSTFIECQRLSDKISKFHRGPEYYFTLEYFLKKLEIVLTRQFFARAITRWLPKKPVLGKMSALKCKNWQQVQNVIILQLRQKLDACKLAL
jgi:hypothetical protein